MGKKIILYFLSFIGLIVINFYLLQELHLKANQSEKINGILTEIEEDGNFADQFSFSSAPFATDPFQTQIKLSDGRAANLKIFFRKHSSPLYHYADKIVAISDKYGFDYRLLPAIAMQESTLCRNIPADSHNCWGWGIYGNTVTKFPSYSEGIEVVAAGIKKEYLDKGLTTASKIMAKYTPSSKGSWAFGVNSFLRALE